MAKQILVVDDEADDLQTMKTILEKEGYGAITSDDGAKALEILEKDSFDMVLMDIKMPKLSGYELLRLIREKINHKIPLVFVSVVPKKEVDISDIDGFIQKPFTPEDFIKEIKRAFEEFKATE